MKLNCKQNPEAKGDNRKRENELGRSLLITFAYVDKFCSVDPITFSLLCEIQFESKYFWARFMAYVDVKLYRT